MQGPFGQPSKAKVCSKRGSVEPSLAVNAARAPVCPPRFDAGGLAIWMILPQTPRISQFYSGCFGLWEGSAVFSCCRTGRVCFAHTVLSQQQDFHASDEENARHTPWTSASIPGAVVDEAAGLCLTGTSNLAKREAILLACRCQEELSS